VGSPSFLGVILLAIKITFSTSLSINIKEGRVFRGATRAEKGISPLIISLYKRFLSRTSLLSSREIVGKLFERVKSYKGGDRKEPADLYHFKKEKASLFSK